jgi:hypothetical protein
MSQSGPMFYPMDQLLREIALEAIEPYSNDLFPYYRTWNGEFAVTGFADDNYTIRPGMTINTNDLIFLESHGVRVAVDQYGDIHLYLFNSPMQTHLCCIIADAKKTVRDAQEVAHVTVEHHSDLADIIEREFVRGWKYS